MAVFGIDLAGQIQKLRRERRFGLGLIKLLYPGVKGDEELGRQVCRDMAFTTMGYVVMQAQQRVGGLCWRYWFDYVAEAEHATYINGAWHGNEVPYVFDTLGQVEPSRQYVNERETPRDHFPRLAFRASPAGSLRRFLCLSHRAVPAFPREHLLPPAFRRRWRPPAPEWRP